MIGPFGFGDGFGFLYITRLQKPDHLIADGPPIDEKLPRLPLQGLAVFAGLRKDIDAMAAICNDLKDASWKIGHGGKVTREAAGVFLENAPELQYHPGFAMVFHWFVSGAKTAFIQDAAHRPSIWPQAP